MSDDLDFDVDDLDIDGYLDGSAPSGGDMDEDLDKYLSAASSADGAAGEEPASGGKLKAFFAAFAEFDVKKLKEPGYAQKYIQTHTAQAIGVVVLIFVVLLLLCCSLFASAGGAKAEKDARKKPVLNVKPMEDALILPQEPGITDSYQFYREQKDKWSREEAEKWFTAPDNAMLEELEETNNALISDVLGAVQ